MERYLLQPAGEEGMWVVIDTETGVQCRFRQWQFNETQKMLPPKDALSRGPEYAGQLAASVNGIAEFVAVNHRVLALGPDAVRAEASASIAEQLKDARREKGYSQRQLGALTGISFNHIHLIEVGKYTPRADTLAVLCSVLECNIEF